jgi:hypothetical protein
MKTVYYASFAPPEFIGSHYMLFQEPDPLLQLIAKDRNKQNRYENYIDCPAFQNTVKNTFVVRNAIDMSLQINSNGIHSTDINTPESASFWMRKPSSRNLPVVNFHLNYIFFSNDLEITTTPAYLHDSEFQRKLTYIPGSYNIGKWFRPIEGAFELKSAVLDLQFKNNDPMYYIKFHTDEKINFVRFEFTSKLYQMSMGCMNYKKLKLHSSLLFLYNLFHKSLANKVIEREIKANIVA